MNSKEIYHIFSYKLDILDKISKKEEIIEDDFNELSYIINESKIILEKTSKKIIEDFFGKPDKYKLSDLLKNNFKLYPLDHSFDLNAIIKFINASEDDIKNICKKIIDNTEHISFERFLLKFNNCIYELLVYIINTIKDIKNLKPIYVYINFNKYEEKSNYWLYTYFYEFIKYISNDKINILLLDKDNILSLQNDDIIVVPDDCIYMGNHIYRNIKKLNENIKDSVEVNIFILVPFISEIGFLNIQKNFKKNKLIFPKMVHKPKLIKDILSNYEIMILQKYYINFLDIEKELVLIYFDHKLADKYSTITPFYLGVVPSIKNLNIMRENEFLNDINGITIIPIIKNCRYYINNLDVYMPECPINPYKKTYKEFIEKVKGKKEYFSLNNEKEKKPEEKIHSY